MKACMWTIAVLWFVTENTFFGWNLTPHSANELLADGISYVLIALAVMSGRLGVTINVQNYTKDTVKVDGEVVKGKSIPIK